MSRRRPFATLAGRRCLVLGAGGFLGRAVTAALLAQGAEVQGFGRTPAEAPLAGMTWTRAVFDDHVALAGALAGQDIVFHLLGESLPDSSNRDPAGQLAGEITPTLRLLDLCRAGGIRKLVFASSGGTVYGVPSQVPTPETAATWPISAYGISRLMVERYLELYRHLHGMDYQVLRIANPYGPGQSPFRPQGVVAAMMHSALSFRPVELWGTGETIRDFIHVDDVAAAFIAASIYDGAHRVMNVGSGEGRSIRAVAADVARTLGREALAMTARPARMADVPVSILDASLLRRETGWAPAVPWAEGLRGNRSLDRIATKYLKSFLVLFFKKELLESASFGKRSKTFSDCCPGTLAQCAEPLESKPKAGKVRCDRQGDFRPCPNCI